MEKPSSRAKTVTMPIVTFTSLRETEDMNKFPRPGQSKKTSRTMIPCQNVISRIMKLVMM